MKKKKKILIAYKMTQDFDAILAGKSKVHKAELKKKRTEFEANQRKLLPYVLQLLDGMITIHNMRCVKASDSVTGEKGLFGLATIDKDEELNNVLLDFNWNKDGSLFTTCLGVSRRRIWLNGHGHHHSHPSIHDTEYSMESVCEFNGDTYGESIESEMELLIDRIAKQYPDKWKSKCI